MHNSAKRFLFSVIVWALLVAGFGWQAQAQSSSNKETAEAIGWAIGCGCLKHDKETVVRYLEIFFPDLSSQQAASLAGRVSIGVKESKVYDNSDQICSNICTRVDWDEINSHISKLNSIVAKATPQLADQIDGEWTFEIREPQYMPSGDKVTVNVVDGRFTANVSANGWRGEVSGTIDRFGVLVAGGSLRKPSRPLATLKWSGRPSDDRYDARVPANTNWGPNMTFEVSLYR
jgi:hypothetical protein